MKEKITFYSNFIILLFTTFLLGCSDDTIPPEPKNEIPIIEIITRIDAVEIITGPIVIIETNIFDDDGIVTDAKLFVDNIETKTLSAPPYIFSWDTMDENEGIHIIKIIASDDKGATTIIEKQVTLSNSFTCGNDFFDARDGNIYKTVEIGDQCWMAQNLNYKTEEGSWDYDNKKENGEVFGKLYKWQTALEVSPDGWHLPTDEEWNILEAAADSKYGESDYKWDAPFYRGFDSGYNLKSTTGWNENGNGTDILGFNVVPGGFLSAAYADGVTVFNNLGWSAPFWTATRTRPGDDQLWTREMFSEREDVLRLFESSWAFAVRCIKD